MDYISAYLDFDTVELILLAIFIFFFCIELFYYLFFYKAPQKHIQKLETSEDREDSSTQELPSVSVLIVSTNEAYHLEKSLPKILEQQYPNFEVIVVNNGSTDETEDLVTSLQREYSNLYGTYLPLSRDNIFGRKKLAITIGAKASKNEVILFTEPYCLPQSEKWIATMIQQLSKDKAVVAGHSSFYEKPRTFATRLIAYDNLMYCLQYFSMILKGKPFSATYRNLAIRKKLFFEHKGFASVLNHEHGEELLLNQILTKDNTTLCLNEDAFVISNLEDDEKFVWKGNKAAYQKIKKHFKGIGSWIFRIESCSRFALLLSWLLLVAKSVLDFQFVTLIIATVLAIVLIIIQMRTINKAGKILKSGKYYFSWPILNMLQPFRNLYFKRIKDKSRKTIGNY